MAEDGFDHNEDFARGVELRREVLGDAHVSRSLAKAHNDPFLKPMQQITTEFGWGTVWNRDGLPRKTKSFLSCAFLIALGHHEEFRVHVRGAINNGATQEEILELLIHAAVYCGFPVALEGTRLAKEVFDAMEAEQVGDD
jgi:4-carboxymuconolactone decarboxylase